MAKRLLGFEAGNESIAEEYGGNQTEAFPRIHDIYSRWRKSTLLGNILAWMDLGRWKYMGALAPLGLKRHSHE